MRKPAKRNVTVATSSATPAKPVKPVAKPRNVKAGTTIAAKPETAPAAIPAVATPVPVTANAVADMPRGLTRDAAGIVRYATNFNQYSDRDHAYLAFFGTVMRQHNGSATLRQIHDAGITRSGMPDRKRFNPNYTGSGKATDVGAINRLCKAGYLNRSADGNTLTATKLATDSAIYRGTKSA